MENRLHQLGDVSQKLIPNKQEAVRVGNLVVLAQHDQEALNQQKGKFLTRNYQVDETVHFVVCRKPSDPQTVLLHTFGQAEIDADLICFIENELPAFGFISSAQEFGATLFAVLASPFPPPRHQPTVWQRFCLNTLAKMRQQMAHPLTPSPTVSYVTPFAAIYRRVFDLFIGRSFLDVGCSFGFLPVLMAEHAPNAPIMGCDTSPDALQFSIDLATVTGARQVMFTLQDVLNPTIRCLGTFDTVTAIHLLEHLAEEDVAVALSHLLQLSSKRLILAVPFEEEAQELYGHRQVFTLEKLHSWGRWCVQALGGPARYQCEEVAGGLLIVDRLAE